MKVLIVSFAFPPSNVIGAVRVGKLARYLDHRGHDVRVLTEDSLIADVAAAGCRFEPFVEAPNRATRDEDLVGDWQARTPLGAFARARAEPRTCP